VTVGLRRVQGATTLEVRRRQRRGSRREPGDHRL